MSQDQNGDSLNWLCTILHIPLEKIWIKWTNHFITLTKEPLGKKCQIEQEYIIHKVG